MVTGSSFLVMAIYLFATLLISFLVNRRKETRGDFATGGRQFGWVTAGISILATYISAMTFVGMPGWIYQEGMQALIIHLNYPIVVFFTVVFFIPVFYKLGLTSIYEYLEHRFGVKVRTINAIVFIVVRCISAGIILYTVSLILVMVIPISIEEAIIYISIFTAFYTYCGGISTVIWTDVMQSMVLLLGSVAVLVCLVLQIPDSNLLAAVPDKLEIINTSLDFTNDTTLWSGLIAVTFLHLSVYGSNQLIIQRTLATRSVHLAQKSMLICGYGAFFVYAFFSLVGILLFVFYDGEAFTNSNNIILDFVFHHTNPVIVGLVMSALMAAAMSSLDSTYNSMATVATVDIYRRFIKPDAEATHYESMARRLSISCSVLVIIPAILAISNESVLKSIASLVSIFVGIQLGSFVLGLISRTANETGAVVASVISMLVIAGCWLTEIAWPWYAPIGTVVFIVVGYVVSQWYGSLSSAQQAFVDQQKLLYQRPALSHYLLLVFALVTVISCLYLPDILLTVIS